MDTNKNAKRRQWNNNNDNRNLSQEDIANMKNEFMLHLQQTRPHQLRGHCLAFSGGNGY